MAKNQYIIVLLLALVGLTAALGVDIYLPSLPAMATWFQQDISQVQLTISLYVIGFAIGQLILGPISDRYGRKPVLLVCLGLYFTTCVLSLFINSLISLIILRVFQALGACTGSVILYAYIRDIMPVKEGVKAMSMIAMTICLSPLIAPIIGGYLQFYFNWHATFVFLALLSGATFLLIWHFLPESLQHKNNKPLTPFHLLKSYFSLLSDRDYRFLVLANMASFTALFSFISSAPYLLMQLAGVSAEHFGYYFALNAIIMFIGFYLNTHLANHLSIKHIVILGGGFMLLGSSIMLIVSFTLPVTPLHLLIPMMVSSMGISLLMPTTATSALLPYPKTAGTASAMAAFSRFAGASLVATLLGYIHVRGQLPLAITLLLASLAVIISFYAIEWKKYCPTE